MDSQGNPSGVLVAGGENGNVILYDPAKIMAGESDVIIAESDKHTGPVRALDVNPFQVWSVLLQCRFPSLSLKLNTKANFVFCPLLQTNLVASGGNESEIYIWDMNNFDSPMTPGPKTQVVLKIHFT